MRYRNPDALLPEIPVIDCDEGGAERLFDLGVDGAKRLTQIARRTLTPPVVAWLDWRSRKWAARNDSPYVPEIEHIAERLPRAGVHALNLSYEWACTTAAVAPAMMRALDWRLDGMGGELVVARHRSPAGPWLNITWPGFVGVLTALAPGRFAAAINQAPLRRRSYLLPIDWAIDRLKIDGTRAVPSTHLLRLVFETCSTFDEAVEVLRDTPIALPTIFALSGANGEACVIERQEEKAFVFDGDEVMANHWLNSQWRRGRSRGLDSEGRWRALRAAAKQPEIAEGFGWLRPPVLNRLTRLAAVMNAATGALSVIGLEAKGTIAMPVTKPLTVEMPLPPKR